jgi:hypothetical protein
VEKQEEQKEKFKLTVNHGEKTLEFSCDQDCTLGTMLDALSEMKKYVLKMLSESEVVHLSELEVSNE